MTSKDERILIVVNHISSGKTDHLYRSIEGAAQFIVPSTLGDDYAKTIKLYGINATLPKLIGKLRTEGKRNSVKRIDLLLMLHGKPGIIVFKDGEKDSDDVKNQIKALNIRTKLRLLYSTCCYGDSHSADFIDAGFDTAIGSKKVNANAAVEFAPLLSFWQFDFKISDCLAITVPATPAAEAAARLYGESKTPPLDWADDVDSTKVLRGNPNIKIST